MTQQIATNPRVRGIHTSTHARQTMYSMYTHNAIPYQSSAAQFYPRRTSVEVPARACRYRRHTSTPGQTDPSGTKRARDGHTSSTPHTWQQKSFKTCDPPLGTLVVTQMCPSSMNPRGTRHQHQAVAHIRHNYQETATPRPITSPNEETCTHQTNDHSSRRPRPRQSNLARTQNARQSEPRSTYQAESK